MRAPFGLFAVLVLAGCATGYQAQGYSGGFSETWQSERSVEVTYNGNGYTSTEQAERYALLRAAELTLERGFTHFRRAEAQTEVDVRRSGSILTGGRRTSRKPGVEIVAVLLSEAEARELERQGVPIVAARFYVEQNAPAKVRARILGERP